VTVKIDREDLSKLLQHRWYADEYKNTYYVKVSTSKAKIYLHRVILGLGKGNRLTGDHYDGNGLNNTKRIDGVGNLQAVTRAVNNQNKISARSLISPLPRGVHWHPSNKGWVARVGKIHLGTFETVDAAEAAAIAGREKYFVNSNEDRTGKGKK